ncbi:MAG: DUF4293 domain-containing protein [Fermentimonas sp.]|jgi:hypothetical protein
MIQRVQTLFLALAAAAMLVAVSVPLATFVYGGQPVVFEAMGVYYEDVLRDSTWGIFVIGILSSIIPLITIFLYKRRILQIRLSVFNIFLMIGYYAYAGFVFYHLVNFNDMAFNKIGFGAVTPIIAIILTIIAIRKIGADEALIQSLKRLR